MRKTQFPIVKLVRKPRILSFLTQIPTFLRIVGNSAARFSMYLSEFILCDYTQNFVLVQGISMDQSSAIDHDFGFNA